MLLSVGQIAEALQLTEKTVQRWVRREGLKGTLIDGSYRVNRVDLLEWATEHGIKIPPGLCVEEAPPAAPQPLLTDALVRGGIHCQVPGTDKLGVLQEVVRLLPLPPQADPEFLLQVLLAREALGTTAIGDGIAIPHVRNPLVFPVGEPSVTLCFLQQPVDFGALDGKPVQILFTLISPTVQGHLQLLARLAFVLRDERVRSVLRQPCRSGEILAVIAGVEQEARR